MPSSHAIAIRIGERRDAIASEANLVAARARAVLPDGLASKPLARSDFVRIAEFPDDVVARHPRAQRRRREGERMRRRVQRERDRDLPIGEFDRGTAFLRTADPGILTISRAPTMAIAVSTIAKSIGASPVKRSCVPIAEKRW